MKYTLHLLIGLILTGPMASSQIVLPKNVNLSALSSYTSQWEKLVNFLTGQHAPPDIASSFTEEDELQLDSAVTVIGNDAGGGNVIVVPFSKSTYQYPNSRVMIETEWNRIDDHWLAINRTQQRFDEQGRLFAVFAEIYDPELAYWAPDSRFIVHFHGSSSALTDSIFIEAWSQELNKWSRIFTLHNTIDSLGRIAESYHTIFEDEEKTTFKEVHHYDHLANQILTESFLIDDDLEILISIEEHDYVLNYLLSSTVSISDGLGGLIPESKITYSYTGHGTVDSISSYEYMMTDNTWSLIQGIYYQFDERNQMNRQETVELTFGNITKHEMILFHYLDEGHLASETFYHVDPETGLQSFYQRTIYHYSSMSTSIPIPPKFEVLQVWPNPTQDQVEMVTTRPGFLRIYNINGQLIEMIPVSEGRHIIHLSRLPSGLYSLILNNHQELYRAQVVKH